MPVYFDQLGREVAIPLRPQRIVSLVPSQTELLFDLGLEDEVVGITKFCVHPTRWLRNKKRVGGTKALHIETIRTLRPDLILANKEENTKAEIQQLAQEFPVWISDISNISEAADMIETVGSIVGRSAEGGAIASRVRHELTLPEPGLWSQERSCVYLIWNDPLMTVGGDSFISHMLGIAGFTNTFSHLNRYPLVTIEDIHAADPEFILLSSEPYPFSEKHLQAFRQLFPGRKIVLVDGEMFSWYGSRMLGAPAYFAELNEQIKALSVL